MKQEFAGTTYYFNQNNGRYHAPKTWRMLHHDVYSDRHGNIPHGWVVHHRDEDVHNNVIENLQAMPKREHDALHRARLRAAVSMSNRTRETAMVDLVCAQCGSEFRARHYPREARCCSKNCWNKRRAA
jgi:HNH endonuclease.